MVNTKIEYFDCSSEVDMQKSEQVLALKEIIKSDVVTFPYLMLIWKE